MTRKNRFFSFGLALVIVVIGVALGQAQTPPSAQPHTTAQPQQKCLRALDGFCTNPAIVEAARLRAIIMPTERVSYVGTPAGTVGGTYIPFDRLFRDNDKLFGLPTNTFILCPACIFRSK